MADKITVPTLGESLTEATVAKWLKKVGDSVQEDEEIVSLETDKVSIDVTAPKSGILSEIVAKDGATVEVGAHLGSIDASASPAKKKEVQQDKQETTVVEIKKEENTLLFSAKESTKHSIAMSGTIRALVQNMVLGVSVGFERKLQLIGVGYKAQAQGNKINLELGFSHSITHALPEGVSAQTPSQTEIILKSSDKQVVGQVAAEIRAYRPPEPYKGKGVRYVDEQVVMKEAKKA